MGNKIYSLFFFFSLILIYSAPPKNESVYIDQSLPSLVVNNSVTSKSFHIFSHGKPGELFIDNKWLDAPEIAVHFAKELKNKKELYIYGCNFGEGEIGRKAVQYLQKNLDISVNASTNITGKDGDWILEIGKGKNGLKIPEYREDLQLDTVHYLNPIICGSYNNTGDIQEEFIYISTPSSGMITVQMNYASGVGSPKISITDLTSNTTVTNTTGSFTVNNSNPVRIQFLNATGAVSSIGTTPTTVPLTTGGTIISGNTAGLKFTSTEKFYVNYRIRSNAQAGSVLTKGASALGREFRWGGSPVEFATAVVETGNMLSVMATKDNTTIVINNIKTGTKFVNGTGGTTLAGPTITKILQKGDSFVLYAPIVKNTLSIQDTGWLGAKVVSDKDVAVSVGGLLQQGNDSGSRDIGLDQLVPINLLGLEHVIMQGNGVAREKVIVVSTSDNTKVYVNGSSTAFATLTNAGDYVLIPSTSFNTDKNMFVRVSSPAYVFNKIYGSDAPNTNSLMFIPPVSCFGQKTVDLVPDARRIGTTAYDGTELVVLAATAAGVPAVTENGSSLASYTPAGGDVLGNPNWKSYRFKLSGTLVNDNVKVSSTGTIQAEIFGANGVAGYGGYFSGFGDAPSYNLSVTTKFAFLCPGTDSMSVPANLGVYQWYRGDVAGTPNSFVMISGATSNIYSLTGADDLNPASYYVMVTFPGGCSINSNIVTSDTCPCFKPSTTGTPDSFTKLGISVRDARTSANWPNDVANGFLAMEANKKGFVITRLAFPETAIPTPVAGMLVYDTNKNCLEMYNGTVWKCIKQTCN